MDLEGSGRRLIRNRIWTFVRTVEVQQFLNTSLQVTVTLSCSVQCTIQWETVLWIPGTQMENRWRHGRSPRLHRMWEAGTTARILPRVAIWQPCSRDYITNTMSECRSVITRWRRQAGRRSSPQTSKYDVRKSCSFEQCIDRQPETVWTLSRCR